MTDTKVENTTAETDAENTSEKQQEGKNRLLQEVATTRPPASIQIDLHLRIEGVEMPEGGLTVSQRAVDEGGQTQKLPGDSRGVSTFQSNG